MPWTLAVFRNGAEAGGCNTWRASHFRIPHHKICLGINSTLRLSFLCVPASIRRPPGPPHYHRHGEEQGHEAPRRYVADHLVRIVGGGEEEGGGWGSEDYFSIGAMRRRVVPSEVTLSPILYGLGVPGINLRRTAIRCLGRSCTGAACPSATYMIMMTLANKSPIRCTRSSSSSKPSSIIATGPPNSASRARCTISRRFLPRLFSCGPLYNRSLRTKCRALRDTRHQPP